MTHIENVPHILQFGITHRDSANCHPNYTPIGDETLIDVRSQKMLILTNDKRITLGDYIPFYFGVRMPMLYVIQRGFNSVKKTEAENVVYCVCNIQKVVEEGVEFVFTDGHATDTLTNIYPKDAATQIPDLLDFEAIQSKYWKDENDLDLKRRKEAEFLIKTDTAPELITGFTVYNQTAKERLINVNTPEKMIGIRPQFYF